MFKSDLAYHSWHQQMNALGSVRGKWIEDQSSSCQSSDRSNHSTRLVFDPSYLTAVPKKRLHSHHPISHFTFTALELRCERNRLLVHNWAIENTPGLRLGSKKHWIGDIVLERSAWASRIHTPYIYISSNSLFPTFMDFRADVGYVKGQIEKK